MVFLLIIVGVGGLLVLKRVRLQLFNKTPVQA